MLQKQKEKNFNKAQRIPRHLGIIMDGNRRWAKEKGLPSLEGHRRGYEKLKEIGKLCFEKGIKILTVFAFSTENWNRSKEEVSYLMKLLKKAVKEGLTEFHKRDIQIRISGRINQLSKDLQRAIFKTTEKTKDNQKGIINIALNYGGRMEIIDAIKKIINKKIGVAKIDEKTIKENLYTEDLPDPDLIIRTSGEQRLSGFLLWQSAYSELYFTKKYWPDFGEMDLEKALKEYSERERRFGK